MLGFAKHFVAFCNEFNKYNNTGARISDSTSHIALKLL